MSPPLPQPPEGAKLIHTRQYHVQVFRRDATTMILRGVVQDTKPGNLYIAEDDGQLTIHHMIVDLDVRFPDLTIVAVNVDFESFPHDTCPAIVEHYAKLVGMSIGRGFLNRVRELFGGPRGCTHTTALLQAMAPAAVQASFSMRFEAMRESQQTGATIADAFATMTPEDRRRQFAYNINTCHVWDENGEQVRALESGTMERGTPLFIRKRLAELGRDGEVWQTPMRA